MSNWRSEAAQHLDLDEAAAAALIGGADPKGLARCVKLNNYWCIKGAGWNGMIAADAEGHAAFSSALEGATVAALLLRRYYLEFARKSASAIVSRWAPPQCGGPVTTARTGSSGRLGLLHKAPNLGPDPGLALHGLGATLRARYLAARRSGRRAALPHSRVNEAPVALIHAPTIAQGFGEVKVALPALQLAALTKPLPAPAGGGFIPFGACSLDGPRLRNYALKAIAGVADSPDADLKLFEADGEPTAVLPSVLENMSSVEIGPHKADPELVRAGISAATAAMRAARAAAAPTATDAAPELRPSTPADTPDATGGALRGATTPVDDH